MSLHKACVSAEGAILASRRFVITAAILHGGTAGRGAGSCRHNRPGVSRGRAIHANSPQ
jgi:hypothetical protein